MGNLSTDFLYARPSLIEGFARVLDIAGTLNEYNQALTPNQADRIALAADWYVIGNDLRSAIGQFAEQLDGTQERE